jgi:hypothetical protein
MGLSRDCSTRRRRHRAVSALRTLVAVAVASASLAVGASPAAAAGMIEITSPVRVVDGQVVAAAGSGWITGDQVGYCQAVPVDPVGPEDCGGPIGFTAVDANGNFGISLFVSRFITVQGTDYDCAAASSPCLVAAADIGNVAGTAVWDHLEFVAGPPVMFPGNSEVPEGDSGTTTLEVPVTLSFASTETVSAQWTTNTSSCPFVETADPATDYTPASGTVTFVPGDTSETLPISVNGDTLVEPDECVPISFTNPINATIGPNPAGGGSIAHGVIRTDEVVSPDLVIKRRSDGTLFFHNVYTINPSTYRHTIAPGGYWTFAILVQNDGDTTGDIRVVPGTVATSPFDVQFFYGYYDVTSAMLNGGLLLPAMAPGETRPIAVRFHADPGTPTGTTSGDVFLGAYTSDILDALRLEVVVA